MERAERLERSISRVRARRRAHTRAWCSKRSNRYTMTIHYRNERDKGGTVGGTVPERSAPASVGRVAIDIEALLVWAYAKQAVLLIDDRDDGPDYLGGMRSGDGCARLAWYGALGTRPDGGQYKGLSSPTSDDAEIVHAVVRTIDCCELVIQHAKARSVPAWDLRAKRVAAMVASDRWDTLNGRPKPKVVYTDDGRHWGYCPVTFHWLVSPAEAKAARRDYENWHEALGHIRAALVASNALTRFRPTGPARPAEPWLRQPEP